MKLRNIKRATFRIQETFNTFISLLITNIVSQDELIWDKGDTNDIKPEQR